jgi:hypothetical protein
LRMTNMILFSCNHVLEHIQMTLRRWGYKYREPGGMAILQIPQDLSRAATLQMTV